MQPHLSIFALVACVFLLSYFSSLLAYIHHSANIEWPLCPRFCPRLRDHSNVKTEGGVLVHGDCSLVGEMGTGSQAMEDL